MPRLKTTKADLLLTVNKCSYGRYILRVEQEEEITLGGKNKDDCSSLEAGVAVIELPSFRGSLKRPSSHSLSSASKRRRQK